MEKDRDGLAARKTDVLAGVLESVVEVLVAKVSRAVDQTGIDSVSVSGGVAANSRLRILMDERAVQQGFRVVFPDRDFCTDNAAMIAWVGRKRLMAGERSGLDAPVQPGWMLETVRPPIANETAQQLV
ncbi:hypothetical protein AMJ86_09995 [bacterium SM23_57]|nr:MAG: hypothetical protein AMJ86_09995 [bacterium SM23_57]